MAKGKRIVKKSQKSGLILGIESSADDTAAAVVKDGNFVLSNSLFSQVKIHKKYGGIIPEVASRKHIESMPFVVEAALKEAEVTLEEVDKIAVTTTPGLKPALLVGQSYAQGLALGANKPLLEVNHLFGHVYANFLLDKDSKKQELPEFPVLTLLVSGGHTQLIISTDHTNQKIIGETLDDAAGEAFDKVARMLDIGYPGGPIIDKRAQDGFEDAIAFPRPMIDSEDYTFSFSGLKTSVKTYIEKNSPKHNVLKLLTELQRNFIDDVAASFQEAVVDVLVSKTISAALELNIETIAIAGGVAANSRLRDKMGREASKNDLKLFYPPLRLCTDNAAMIAGASFHL